MQNLVGFADWQQSIFPAHKATVSQSNIVRRKHKSPPVSTGRVGELTGQFYQDCWCLAVLSASHQHIFQLKPAADY